MSARLWLMPGTRHGHTALLLNGFVHHATSHLAQTLNIWPEQVIWLCAHVRHIMKTFRELRMPWPNMYVLVLLPL